MSLYARQTEVSVERSKGEIEKTLARYGAGAFAYATSGAKAMVQFQANNRRIMFVLPLPDPSADEYRYYSRNGAVQKHRERHKADAAALWEKACRQKWRCLALSIKAKLEAVESGIATFEEEFMAHIVLPDGKTVGQHMLPQIAASYESKKLPPMLPNFGK